MLSLNIRIAENGFILEYDDPEIRERNYSSDGPWQDPTKSVVFQSPEELAGVVARVLPLLKAESDDDETEDNNDASFKAAFKEALSKGS